jgi:hypothetical protein
LYQDNQTKDSGSDNLMFKDQDYMASIDDSESNLDSLYSNNDLNDAKNALDNEQPISQQDLDSYIRTRSEMPSNYEDSINMNISDSNKINSEDIEQVLDKSLNTEDETKQFMEKTLLSTNKVFERRKKRVLTIDVSNFLQNVDATTPAIINYANNYWEHFKVNFQEDFIVDKVSDVFLESLTINNPCKADNYSSLYKVLEISEFNVKTTTNNVFMKDKFVLPNENTASVGNNKIMKYHLKSNYICTVNPQKISSLTFKLTDENNDGVGVSLTESGSLVNKPAGYDAGIKTAVTVDNGVHFKVFDAVFNVNKQFLGIVTRIDSNDLYFGDGTNFNVVDNEKLYVADSTHKTGILSNSATTQEIGSTTLIVDSVDATTIFSVGDRVYLGNGAILGKLSAVAAQLLTFESGISHRIPDNVFMYKKSPLPKVFASDNPNNKIIMEFVFITR